MTQTIDQSCLTKTAAFPRAVSCLNALTHGGASVKLFIPGEDPALFDTLMDEAFTLYQPATYADAALVTDSVEARWILWRRQKAHQQIEHDIFLRTGGADTFNCNDMHDLALFDRYKTQAERALKRALSNVATIGKDQLQAERWRQQLALQKARFDLEREKFELIKAKDARLAPKQAAEAEIDAAIAKNALAAFHKRQADKLEIEKVDVAIAANRKAIHFSEPLNCHVIRQTVTVCCCDDGSAYIDYISPSHDEVRKIIQHSDQYQTPPQFVVRKFNFNSYVPSEYSFVLDDGHRKPINGNFLIEYTFDFDRYIELAEKELAILANQPADDEDDEDEEGEEDSGQNP